MRHFHNINEMAEALALEAKKLGGDIERREEGIIVIVKTECECGAHCIAEINATALAATIWEAMS